MILSDPMITTWLCTISTISVTIYFVHSVFRKTKRKNELSLMASLAVQKRNDKIHKCLTFQISKNEKEKELYSAMETVQLIRNGKLDACENVVTLARRCRKYGRGGVNAITEEFYDEAYEAARNLPSSKDLLLHGVPISVKDSFGQKNALMTGGLQCRTHESHRCTEDSLVVQILRSAGALPLVRGNALQAMMLADSTNRIWGTTSNPWDLSRSPGGSSGGEGALVAMRCVPLAVGGDVGGSARIPAAYCGVVGFKPTSTRLSMKGCMKPRKNNRMGLASIIPATICPIATTVDDCAAFMKALCGNDLFRGDLGNVPPLPFDEGAYDNKKKLKIGYFLTDEWFEPCTAAKRATLEAVQALETNGHFCVPFQLPTNGWESYGLLAGINAADGIQGFIEGLEGEDLLPIYNMIKLSSRIPNFLRPMLAKLLSKRHAHLIRLFRSGGISVYDLWEKMADLKSMRDQWSTSFQKHQLDAVIFPSLPLPAMPHGVCGNITPSFSYMFFANLLLWPCGSVPITTVREDEECYYEMNDIPSDQRDAFVEVAKKVMVGSEGLPVSVNVMAPGFRDEVCLRVMREVERGVDFKEKPVAYLRSEKKVD